MKSTYGTAIVCCVVVAPLAAQQASTAVDSSSFAVLRGTDTLATERYVRSAGMVRGELAVRGQGITRYEMTLTSGERVSRIAVRFFLGNAPPDATPAQQATFEFDSAGASLIMNGSSTRVAAPANTLPFINLSVAAFDQILRRARAVADTAAAVPVLALAGAQNAVAHVRWITPDSAVLTLGPEVGISRLSTGGIRGAAAPSQGITFVRLLRGADAMTSVANYGAPADAPYSAEDVSIRNLSDSVTLAGTLTMPRRSSGARVPAVVLITGSGAQDRDESTPQLPGWRPFREIADTLSRRGIAVLRLDDRGVGGSGRGSMTATSADFANDIRAAMAFLRRQPGVDSTRIALLGHSEGGMIAPMIAASDRAVRALVLIGAPSRTGRVISDYQVAQALDAQHITGSQRDSLIRLNAQVRDSMAGTVPWMKYWMEYDPLPAARRVRAPVLIAQGATDRQITADQADELGEAIRSGGNRSVTVRIFPDLNHLLVNDPDGAPTGYASLPSYAVRKDFLEAVADWLSTTLAGR